MTVRMSGKKREIELRRLELSKLYLSGIKDLTKLGELLNCHRVTISRDLKVIQAEWRQLAAKNLDMEKGKALASLTMVEREYWQAWALWLLGYRVQGYGLFYACF